MATVRHKSDVQRLVLHGISWRAYERLLRAFDEERHLRITYDRGSLEIMTLSPRHERAKHLLGVLIVALAEEVGVEIAGFGSMTFKRRPKKRGLEPDECYWVQNEARMRGKLEYNLERDPPPDLVLEIDVTSSSLNRMAIYAALGVPEVWRWDGTTLEVNVLGAKGRYAVAEKGQAFPLFRPAELVRFLALEATQGETGMLRTFRAWVRDQKAAGWPANTGDGPSQAAGQPGA
jgi:Uma2 family endonuclease